MTDQPQNPQQQQLAQLLAQLQQPGAVAPGAGWQQPAQAANPAVGLIQGVAVPIKVSTPAGECRCYLSLPAEVGQNPQALINALGMLQSQGYPIDTFQPRNSGGWGGNNGGGWNGGGRGGYGGGGYGGRRGGW